LLLPSPPFSLLLLAKKTHTERTGERGPEIPHHHETRAREGEGSSSSGEPDTMAAATSRPRGDYDHLIKLLLIGDSGKYLLLLCTPSSAPKGQIRSSCFRFRGRS
jgi:hypothetical protein